MAFNPAPTVVFAGWSENGTDITLPIAALPELTAGEADAVTGDSRKILFALMERIYQWNIALADADKPAKVTVTRYSQINELTGVITRTYSLQFSLSAGAIDVVAE